VKIFDSNKISFKSFDVDLVIVGAGIVGTFLAFLFRNSKYKVLLVERGREKKIIEKRTLIKGMNHLSSSTNKKFSIGGNSRYWGGQLSEFRREDIKKNFWGLNYLNLKSLYKKVYKILNIKCDNKIVYNKKYQIGYYFTYFLKNPDLFNFFKNRLIKNKNIIVLTNLIAQKIIFDGKSVKSLKCKNHNNKEININGKKFIFCLGTVENIRFFLTNKMYAKNSPLKKIKNIGNYFQDHFEVYFGSLKICSKKIFYQYFGNRIIHGLVHQPKICNIHENNNQISMCMGFISDSYYSKMVKSSKQILKNFLRQKNLKNFLLLFHPKFFKFNLIYILHYLRFRKIKMFFKDEVKTSITSEQIPLRNSKLVPSKKRLKDGLCQLLLYWKINGKEFYEIRKFLDKLNSFFISNSIGKFTFNKFLFKK